MIIAHLADLHLGYRAYNRLGHGSINVREADVATAFAETVEAIVRLRPHLVLVAGDVFHSVRPSNAAIAEGFRRFASLTERLPHVPVVIVAGDRDTPRSIDTAPILPLLGEIRGVTVVTETTVQIAVDAIGATVVAVPHAALGRRLASAVEPPAGTGSRFLVMHGTLTGPVAAGKLGGFPDGGGGASILEGAITPSEWDYVALGHHPVVAEIAPNVWYSGGIERTSSDVWSEAEVAKGFLSYDTESGAATFHEVHTRPVVNLRRLNARNLSAAEVDAAVAAAVEGINGGVHGKIVRLVITDMARQRMRELDQRRLRAYRAEALHFVIEARPPAPEAPDSIPRPARGQSLDRQVEEFLSLHWVPTMDGIEKRRLARLARNYLDRAGEGE